MKHIQGLSVPNSFFWYTMDYLEFREDGVVWALMNWPPQSGTEIRLNKVSSYRLLDDSKLYFGEVAGMRINVREHIIS